ncbi:MAG TPA: restriction endonuclease subunit S, partial [Victivallales bacterium]|nr:restriction endonuclease subunit S [Victivallales bacterium]
PHRRFSVQSNRSEVLFVDYIAEHLTPTGRAAVIVPEGIIFQSANAYKQLRKMLVENALIAVVSLPAGVFNPYSGVKTSILIMDKQLAKKTDSILFVKIENDGYDLGAQRRPIEKNDLPDALKLLCEYMEAVRSGKADAFTTEGKPCSALLVKKEKLAENREYNLTADRYRVVERRGHQKWPMVRLGEVCEINFGERITKKENEGSIYPVYGGGGESFRTDKYNRENEYVISRFAMSENCVRFVKGKFWLLDSGGTIEINENFKKKVLKDYIGNILLSIQSNIYKLGRGHAQKNLDIKEFKNILIPLPPLEVQQEIVAEIEGYQKLIDGCRQVVNSWKPDVDGYLDEELKQYIEEHPERHPELAEGWQMVKLGEVGKICMCKRIFKEQTRPKGEIPFYKIGTFGGDADSFINKELFEEYRNKYPYPKKGEILISTSGTIGKTIIFNGEPSYFQDSNIVWLSHDESKILNKFLYYIYQNITWLPEKGVTVARLYNKIIEQTKIPLPPLSVQQRIVDRIEAERKVIDGCRELIKIYEENIKRVIDRVWGE